MKIKSNLIKSIDQVQITFPMLLETKQREELINGVFILIEKLDNPEIDRLLDHYEDFIQAYDLKDLLYGEIEVLNASRLDTKTAGILCFMLAIISFSSELIDDENKVITLSEIINDNIALQTIQYIISSIKLEDLLEYLLFTIVSAVGVDYYQKFQDKINSETFTTQDLLTLDNDVELKEHINTMTWFALIRIFLESIYFYFNNDNTHSKNIAL